MKMSIFGMLLVLVLLTVGPLVYFNGGAGYMDSFFNSSNSSKPKLNRDVVYAPVTSNERVKVFKWKDENGIWQFGGSPPPSVTNAESMTLQPNMNVMKSLEVPGNEEAENGGPSVVSLSHSRSGGSKSGKKGEKQEFGISKDSLENPYAPDSISELVNTTSNLQNVLNQRQQQQNVK